MCLNDWSIESGIISRCGLVGVGVALLEKVHHQVVGFEVSYGQASSLPSASADQAVGLSVLLQHHVCLHVKMLFAMMIKD